MAATPPFPIVNLPVALIVGDYTAEVGQLTLGPNETIRGALAELFRAAADALDHDEAEEVSPDAASRG
ncbi:hypothetical protein [Streptomyces shenzhenensis]|uniref:Uncharacterized protein n=1 Tax=Streptomyces shenzhenensis TaxID=943815 RepID=A0A3M0I2Y7_9ACTN|nr:hypothetical protein [Streptomyces shenzhenensis]RMB83657.1 hypothetical protein CTZ28_23355 [Streptomyces shenzhenensis]